MPRFRDQSISLHGAHLAEMASLVDKPNRENDWTEYDKGRAFAYIEFIVSKAKTQDAPRAAAEAKAAEAALTNVDKIVQDALDATGMTLSGGVVDDPLDEMDEDTEAPNAA